MKNIVTVLGVILAVALLLALAFGITYGVRKFSEATIEVSVIEPEPGVHCAKLISTDGAAISCWKVQP